MGLRLVKIASKGREVGGSCYFVASSTRKARAVYSMYIVRVYQRPYVGGIPGHKTPTGARSLEVTGFS